MTDLENWEKGISLQSAFERFTDPYQFGKYRKQTSISAIEVIRMLIFADLFQQIEAGELEAFGFQIEPHVAPGPVQVPRHVFECDPDTELAMRNKVSASGYAYERVRVRRAENAPAPDPVVKQTAASGRTSLYPKSKTVLEKLFRIESNREKSAGKLHRDFEAEFARQYPQKEWGIPPPAPRTLQNHLTKYRHELAGIGSNDFTN